MTEADTAVAQFACTSCHAVIAAACVTAKQKPTTPHAPRLRDARAWLKGASEFKDQFEDASNDREALQAEVTANAKAIASLTADLAAADDALHDSETQRVTAQDVAAAVVRDLRAEVAELEEQVAALTPKPAEPEYVRPSGAGTVRYEDLTGATLQDKLNAPKTRAIVTAPSGILEQADFVQPAASKGPYGLVLGAKCAGIAGSGVDKTFLQLKAMSSSKVANIKPQSTGFGGPGSVGTTNPYKVLHVSGDCTLSRFTVLGTDQPVYTFTDTPPDPQTGRGHNYNGIELYQAGKVVLEHLKVAGIPGSNGANPGETFSIMSGGGASLDLTVTDVEIDGRHPVSGKPNGGSGFYHGGQTPKSVHTDVDVHHMGYGWGYTHYMVTGGKSTYTRVRSRFNPGAFNWERCSAHTFDLIACDNQGTRSTAKAAAGFGAQPIFGVVDSDLGSVVINLRDPKVDDGTGTLVTPSPQHPVLIVTHPGYWGTTQKQSAKDIHVFDAAGVEHPDWLVVLSGYELDGKAQ